MRLATVCLLLCAAAAAQVKAPATYRVEVTLRETDEQKDVKDHKFAMLIEASGWGRIRTGFKVPYFSNKDQVNYADVGNNLDCSVHEGESIVKLGCMIEMSRIAPAASTPIPSTPGMPVIQTRRTNVDCAVPLDRETQISSLYDAFTDRRVEVMVLVRRI